MRAATTSFLPSHELQGTDGNSRREVPHSRVLKRSDEADPAYHSDVPEGLSQRTFFASNTSKLNRAGGI